MPKAHDDDLRRKVIEAVEMNGMTPTQIVFEWWLKICLIPCLHPGQKRVIDNASFHKGGRIEELVKAGGREAYYLPPHSQNLNKIERPWS